MNFGWPCYEGVNRQSGYEGANLDICSALYAEGNAVTAPYFNYDHSHAVVPGESCPTGSSSISGISFQFYAGGPYPNVYDGALFFSDYSRNCIWVMPRAEGSNLPNAAAVQTFVAPAAHPVDLQVSPAGELYYVDFDGGTIRRIVYGAPPPPTSCSPGLFLAQYFTNPTLSGAAATSRCEPAVDYDWGTGAPSGTPVGADGFSVRWTGTHSFAEAGAYTFTATADDGIRVFVDGTAVIDAWHDQGATTYTGVRTLSAGDHTVTVEYYEAAGSAVARVAWSGPPPPPPSCALGTFSAQYFANMTLSGPAVMSRCEPAVDYDWGTGAPSGTPVGVDGFSVRWTGTHSFAEAGAYTFTATADDGIRVFVDGTAVIDAWHDQGATTYTGVRTPSAGGTHRDHRVLRGRRFRPRPRQLGHGWRAAASTPTAAAPARQSSDGDDRDTDGGDHLGGRDDRDILRLGCRPRRGPTAAVGAVMASASRALPIELSHARDPGLGGRRHRIVQRARPRVSVVPRPGAHGHGHERATRRRDAAPRPSHRRAELRNHSRRLPTVGERSVRG